MSCLLGREAAPTISDTSSMILLISYKIKSNMQCCQPEYAAAAWKRRGGENSLLPYW